MNVRAKINNKLAAYTCAVFLISVTSGIAQNDARGDTGRIPTVVGP